jgi:hypothetical protein
MQEQEFLDFYTSYFGEKVDNVNQIVSHNFTGEELKEFFEAVAEKYKLEGICEGESNN